MMPALQMPARLPTWEISATFLLVRGVGPKSIQAGPAAAIYSALLAQMATQGVGFMLQCRVLGQIKSIINSQLKRLLASKSKLCVMI